MATPDRLIKAWLKLTVTEAQQGALSQFDTEMIGNLFRNT
jgi:hypothetical protein